MSVKGWPLLLAVTVAACVAIGAGVYLLSGGTDVSFVVSVLALSLGLALAAIVVNAYMQHGYVSGHMRQMRGELRTAERGFRDSHSRTEYLASQLLEMRQRSDQASSSIMAGLNDLKSSYATLAEQMRTPAPTPAQKPFASVFNAGPPPVAPSSFAPPPFQNAFQRAFEAANTSAPTAPPPRPTEPQQPFAPTNMLDRLSTSLEPIVDLFTGKTSHYRLHLGMTNQSGEEVSSDVLLHHADRTGLRAGFDAHAARDALSLLRRLRQRDEVLSIFLPVGAATLQSEETVARLIDIREEFADVADGLVLEVPHAMLAGLPESGLEGLAQLARYGHTFSLSNVSVGGIDLPSLSKLNVRFVTLNAATVAGAEETSPAVAQFAQSARAMRVHVIVTNVSDMKIVPVISKVSRYASGPAFADPRRVRPDAVHNAVEGYSAVA